MPRPVLRHVARLSLPLSAAALLAVSGTATAATTWGPLAPPNPYLGPVGTSTMHGDAGSSDVTPLAGPGTAPVGALGVEMLSACPTLLEGSDGRVVALCTAIVDQTPTVHLLKPDLSGSAASLPLTKGSLLGGVYAFIDNENRLVAVDGDRKLQKVGHNADKLFIDETVDLSGAIPQGDAVTGLVPDWDGNVWFATGAGVVGSVDPTGVTRTVTLPAGEQVQNSISSSPDGISVATTHALYQLSSSEDGTPEVDWRHEYDRGSARKPGSLSWGTGSTPTYFGPTTGYDYVAIVDNADTQVHLIVRNTRTGDEVCSTPVLAKGGPGSENSPIGVGNTVVVGGTYGYPYPKVPEGAGPAVPATAPFTGGMTRVDIDDDGDGCHIVWDTDVRSSAVPHISTADGLLYTMTRKGAAVTSPLDGYAFTVIDPDTGAVVSETPAPGTIAFDTLQMSALITSRGDYLQGTVSGMVRVTAGGAGGSVDGGNYSGSADGSLS